jgi:hypothetical protein
MLHGTRYFCRQVLGNKGDLVIVVPSDNEVPGLGSFGFAQAIRGTNSEGLK